MEVTWKLYGIFGWVDWLTTGVEYQTPGFLEKLGVLFLASSIEMCCGLKPLFATL